MIRHLSAILPALLVLLMMPCAQGAPESPATVEFRVTRFDPFDGRSPKFRTGGDEASTSFEVPLTYIAGPFKAPLRDGVFLDLWRGDGERPELSVLISRKVEEKWELASTENWPCDPRFRKILFAYMGPRDRHLTFHAVRENVRPAAVSPVKEE